VPHGKLDLLAVEHLHHPVFAGGIRRGGGAGQVLALAKDRRAVGGLEVQHWLEYPGGIAQLLRLFLGVDQKQRHNPDPGPLPCYAAHKHVRLLRVGRPGGNRALCQRDGRAAAAWLPLPDHARLAGHVGGQGRAAQPLIVAPGCRHQQGAGLLVQAAGEAKGRGKHGRGLRRARIDRAFFGAVRAALGQVVHLLRVDALAAGSQHAHQIAVTHAALDQFLFLTACRTVQVGTHQVLQFGAQGGGRGQR
jgi:hypothetical protein